MPKWLDGAGGPVLDNGGPVLDNGGPVLDNGNLVLDAFLLPFLRPGGRISAAIYAV